jgi:hypothetical protein
MSGMYKSYFLKAKAPGARIEEPPTWEGAVFTANSKTFIMPS